MQRKLAWIKLSVYANREDPSATLVKQFKISIVTFQDLNFYIIIFLISKGAVIDTCARKHGFRVIPAFTGHGIGDYFHGAPDIFHFSRHITSYWERDINWSIYVITFFPGNSYPGRMEPGNTFTIEPAISQGTHECIILEDGWTAITADGSRSAQFEHTVLITDNGVEVLTWTFLVVGTSTERIFCYCKSPRRRMDDSHETRWYTKVAKNLAIT